MRDQLVTFDIARLAKEKGFNEEVRDWYNPTQDDELKPEGGGDMLEKYNSTDHLLSAPTQSLLQRWLREVHVVNVWVRHVTDDYYICETTFKKKNKEWLYKIVDTHFIKYEDALEKGLIEALKLI
jgi:hypothetical protein